jgi:hypothetical protein
MYHFGITDCRKLKTYRFSVASNGIKSIPNVIKMCQGVLKQCLQGDDTVFGDDILVKDNG